MDDSQWRGNLNNVRTRFEELFKVTSIIVTLGLPTLNNLSNDLQGHFSYAFFRGDTSSGG